MSCLILSLLMRTHQAITLDPSSLSGYEWKYQALQGRLDVPSMLTLSLAPVGILIEVVFQVLVIVFFSARRSQCPTRLQTLKNQASLTLAARSGYINEIVPIVGKGREPYRATMHGNVDLELELQYSSPTDYPLIRRDRPDIFAWHISLGNIPWATGLSAVHQKGLAHPPIMWRYEHLRAISRTHDHNVRFEHIEKGESVSPEQTRCSAGRVTGSGLTYTTMRGGRSI